MFGACAKVRAFGECPGYIPAWPHELQHEHHRVRVEEHVVCVLVGKHVCVCVCVCVCVWVRRFVKERMAVKRAKSERTCDDNATTFRPGLISLNNAWPHT